MQFKKKKSKKFYSIISYLFSSTSFFTNYDFFYLPTVILGVGFKVGGETDIKYLVLQVHYMKKLGPDNSGVAIESTTEPLDKTAAVLLMVTGGVLPPLSKG